MKISRATSALLAISLLTFLLVAACTGSFLQKGWLYVPTSAYHTEPLPEWTELVQMADSALAKKCRGGENWSLDVFNRLYIGDINTLIVDYEVKKGHGGQCWQVHVQMSPKQVKGVYKTWYAWAGPIDTTLSGIAVGQSFASELVGADDSENRKYRGIYPYIVDVSTGPINWITGDDSGGCYYRVLAVKSEVTYSMFIESIRTDSEAVTRMVDNSFPVDLERFRGNDERGEYPTSPIEVIEWLDWNRVQLQVEGDCFEIVLAESDQALQVVPCQESLVK